MAGGNSEFLPDGRKVLKDDDIWTKVPYQVQLGGSFATMAESMAWSVDQYKAENNGGSFTWDAFRGTDSGHFSRTNVRKMGSIQADSVNAYLSNPLEYIGRSYFKDTRIGCNDAWNAYPQYNRDDDIVHPSLVTQYIDRTHQIGMGRVYAETIQKNQQIAWFTFGIPRFSALATFYLNAFCKEAVDINNMGYSDNFNWDDLFYALGQGAALAIAIPVVPFVWMYNFAKRLLDHPINRYYDLRTTMPLYYRYVDGILAHWLVNAGLFGNGTQSGTFTTYGGDDTTNMDPAAAGIMKDAGGTGEFIAGSMSKWTAGLSSTPLAMQFIGVSMFDIVAHKIALQAGAKEYTSASGAVYLDKLNAGSSAMYNGDGGYGAALDQLSDAWDLSATNWATTLWGSALGGATFVGFRVEKNTDSSESFSNSTTTSSAAEKLNSASQEAAAKKFDMGLTQGANTGSGLIDGFVNGLRDLGNSVLNALGLEDIATVSTGVAIDIPERYSGSDFSKSHSLTFQLRSPYGDPVSIYQNIIIPLSLLLAGSLPRAAGPNSYMSPFLCRVYCKGMFSIPLGIIDNISIKRGSSEYGWTYNHLPTCVDVTISIKDLATAMYCPLESNHIPNLFGPNNTFAEYMLTLAGVGLWERVSRMAQIKRDVQRLGYNIRNHVANPNYWMSNAADTFAVQLVAAFWPDTRIAYN